MLALGLGLGIALSPGLRLDIRLVLGIVRGAFVAGALCRTTAGRLPEPFLNALLLIGCVECWIIVRVRLSMFSLGVGVFSLGVVPFVF